MSGLSLWIGKRLVISTLPDIAMVMVLSLLTAAFTELASNTAVTTILMPIVGCMVIFFLALVAVAERYACGVWVYLFSVADRWC